MEREMTNRVVKSGFMSYDKTVTLGSIISTVTAVLCVGVAWGVMTARQDASDMRQAQTAIEFTRAIARIDEALKEQRTDQKDLSRAVQAITTDTALIRGRLASSDNTGPVRK